MEPDNTMELAQLREEVQALRAELAKMTDDSPHTGDVKAQAHAWCAVYRHCWGLGMDRFLCPQDGTGRGRVLYFITHLAQRAGEAPCPAG